MPTIKAEPNEEEGSEQAREAARPLRVVGEERRRGRGSISNPAGRFEQQITVPLVGADASDWDDSIERPAFKTVVHHERARTILTRNTSPDIPFDRSVNPYRGCEHGCTYCFARPSHAFLEHSPGLDFETQLYAKPNAAELLKAAIKRPGYRAKPVAIGTNTDPYQPIEKNERIMRSILEVLNEANHPVSIVTKSRMILRDLDLLAPMASRNLVHVGISVTTLDRKLARLMEPRAATPMRRIDAIARLSEAGVPVSVLVAPIIPALNDREMEAILEAAHGHGARSANYILLRLPHEVRDIFRDWLAHAYPERYRHVMSLIRQMRGGKDYDAEWMKRMRGEGPLADFIQRRFDLATKRLGLKRRSLDLNCDLFVPPLPEASQMSFGF